MIIPVTTDTIDVSPSQLCWRLGHDGVTASILFESNGITYTKNLICATIKQECIDEATRLGINIPNEVLKNDFSLMAQNDLKI